MAKFSFGPLMVALLLVALFVTGGFAVVAFTPQIAYALTEAEKATLRAEYDKLQVEIAEWQKVLDETRAKKNTLQGDVTVLNAQIKKAEAEIRQRGTVIAQLAGEINQKVARIGELEDKIDGNVLDNTALRIGNSYDNRYFGGLIDDVRIYNRALSDSEIRTLYNATK